MKLIIGIDDTDNLTSKGTGTIAGEIQDIIHENKWGETDFISRHQLFLHEDIQYTSHNSSMIFIANILEEKYEEMKQVLTDYVQNESAEGSDPGICIVKLEELTNKKELIAYGYDAKYRVISQKEAYALAEKSGIYLRALGGTGDGIIGALAGCGLRIGGNDGEIKGGVEQYNAGESYFVQDLLQGGKIVKVCDAKGNLIPTAHKVEVKWKAKPLIKDGVPTLVVQPSEEPETWYAMNKKEMRHYGAERANIAPCQYFIEDVVEEQVESKGNTCMNCAYRRWTEQSFTCMKKER